MYLAPVIILLCRGAAEAEFMNQLGFSFISSSNWLRAKMERSQNLELMKTAFLFWNGFHEFQILARSPKTDRQLLEPIKRKPS